MRVLRTAWDAIRPAGRLLVAVVAVAVIGIGIGFAIGLGGAPAPTPGAVASSGPTAAASGLAAVSPSPSPSPSATPAASPTVSPSPEPSPTPAGADPLLGTDGRLTVLLLGSDYRPAHPGNRTDAIMIVSVDPASGATGAVSIPRDLLNFPLPGGKVYRSKVNALYQHLRSTTKDGDAAMKRAVGGALQVEIDGLVVIGFGGVTQLVDAVGGVTVTLSKAYYDPYYWVNGHTQGWGLSAGKHKLRGTTALIFARSRKGDNDYHRVARQQQLVMAALEKVRAKGPEILPKLLKIVARTVRTDLPPSRALQIYEIVSRAKLGKAKREVLGPKQFGRLLGGSAYELDLKKVRKWVANNFPPVTVGGTWPPAETPSSSPSGTPSP